VRGFDELRHRRSGCGDNNDDARQVSAFLHSVCCLIGIVYRGDICGTLLHRRLYEQVRMTLGQALLSSPLDLEDLNAMFIMSNNANSPSSVCKSPPFPPLPLPGQGSIPIRYNTD
jgi:hypothetical protein